MSRARMWVVGVFADEETVIFGPFSKATAEKMFKDLERSGGPRPFIQPLVQPKDKARKWLPW